MPLGICTLGGAVRKEALSQDPGYVGEQAQDGQASDEDHSAGEGRRGPETLQGRSGASWVQIRVAFAEVHRLKAAASTLAACRQRGQEGQMRKDWAAAWGGYSFSRSA